MKTSASKGWLQMQEHGQNHWGESILPGGTVWENSPGLKEEPGSQLKHTSIKMIGSESHALNPFRETSMHKNHALFCLVLGLAFIFRRKKKNA